MNDLDEVWLRFNFIAPVSRETIERLQVYHNILRRWSKIKNLVASNTLEYIWERHFADSLQIGPLIGDSQTIIDLGSGAGFPGLVIALQAREKKDVIVHLIEADSRKCAFLREVIRETGASATVHRGRIEDVIKTLPVPDVVTARALASLETLVELTHALISSGALGVFLKGQNYRSELTEAKSGCTFEFEIVPSVTDPAAAIILVRSALASHFEVSSNG
jgi:16S rRNA (guanine527-N7)-methyltransferase